MSPCFNPNSPSVRALIWPTPSMRDVQECVGAEMFGHADRTGPFAMFARDRKVFGPYADGFGAALCGASGPSIIFICGLPMNPATNRLARRAIKLKRVADLFDLPARNTDDLVCHGHGLDLIVGDIDHRGLERLVQFGRFQVACCTRSAASRFDSGSSNRKALGSRTMARPIATRWRWPPEAGAACGRDIG